MKERIKDVMLNYKLNAKQLADKIGVQASSVSHILNGRNKPSIEFLEKLLKTYPDIDVHWLITGEKKQTSPQSKQVDDLFSDKGEISEMTSAVTPSSPSGDAKMEVKGDQLIILHADGTFNRYTQR